MVDSFAFPESPTNIFRGRNLHENQRESDLSNCTPQSAPSYFRVSEKSFLEVQSPRRWLYNRGRRQHKLLTHAPGCPGVKKFLPTTGAAGKRTFWCGRAWFSARTSMTRRVLEKLCVEKGLRWFSGPYLNSSNLLCPLVFLLQYPCAHGQTFRTGRIPSLFGRPTWGGRTVPTKRLFKENAPLIFFILMGPFARTLFSRTLLPWPILCYSVQILHAKVLEHLVSSNTSGFRFWGPLAWTNLLSALCGLPTTLVSIKVLFFISNKIWANRASVAVL